MQEPWPIEWRRQIVGWLVNPFPDMFNCSGLWRSAGPTGDDFLRALMTAGSDGLAVTVGGIDGWADDLPDAEGRFAIQWGRPRAPGCT
jgi:hypothetical protein